MWPKAWSIQTGRQRILELRANFPGVCKGMFQKMGHVGPEQSTLLHVSLVSGSTSSPQFKDFQTLWLLCAMRNTFYELSKSKSGRSRAWMEKGSWGRIPTWGAVAVNSYRWRERQFSSGMWSIVDFSYHTHAHWGDVRRMASLCVHVCVCVCIILKE